MKTIIKCTSALLLLFIFSCEEEGPPKTPEKNIIIICDLSSSLNLDYVELEVGKVQSIIDSLPYNTNFSIYPMNLSIYQNSLLKGFIKPETIFKTKNRAIQQEKKDLSAKVGGWVHPFIIHTVQSLAHPHPHLYPRPRPRLHWVS